MLKFIHFEKTNLTKSPNFIWNWILMINSSDVFPNLIHRFSMNFSQIEQLKKKSYKKYSLKKSNILSFRFVKLSNDFINTGVKKLGDFVIFVWHSKNIWTLMQHQKGSGPNGWRQISFGGPKFWGFGTWHAILLWYP